jgi:hypothetical protein
MHEISASTIATWICLALVVLVILGVLRAAVKPLIAVAIVAILLVAIGAVSGDAVSHAARTFVAGVYHFIVSLFSAAGAH